MTIFIDTNIFLSFYQLSRNDLEQLKKLVPLLKHGQNQLILTDQVVDEFYRNRERVIAQTLAELRKGWSLVELPSICRQFSDCEALESSVKEASKHRNRLLNSLNDAIRENALTADLLIREVFDRGTACPATVEITARANQRMLRGSPPGKGKSLGDAINWESLLVSVPQGEDLHLLSADGDYASDLDSSHLSQFLNRECKLLGTVEGRSVFGGLSEEAKLKGAVTNVREKAAAMGATHILMMKATVTGAMGIGEASGRAYRCDVKS